MKRLLARLFVTLTLWWLVGGLMLTALGTSHYFGFFDFVLIFGIVILPAILATIVVWGAHDVFGLETRPAEHISATQSKRKNTSPEDQRLNTLLALMDDDERDAFKQALKDQYLPSASTAKRKNHLIDGELPFDAEDYTYEDNFSRR